MLGHVFVSQKHPELGTQEDIGFISQAIYNYALQECHFYDTQPDGAIIKVTGTFYPEEQLMYFAGNFISF